MFKRNELYVCYLGNPYNNGRYSSECLSEMIFPDWELIPYSAFDLEQLLKPVM